MEDGRRVLVTLRTAGLPPYGFGMVTPATPGIEPASEDPARPTSAKGEQPPSPYPNVELSVYDRNGQEVAAAFIVEHKEPDLDFTLHLRSVEGGGPYTVRATLTDGSQTTQVIEAPFEFR